MPVTPLMSHQLYQVASLTELDPACSSTKHLTPLEDIVGQERAQHAVEFAMSIKEKGYNIYAIGRNGLGKRTMMLRYLSRHQPVEKSSTRYDWCYVVDFDKNRCPKVLRLPAGRANEFKKDIEKFSLRLVKAFPLAFENEMYYTRSEKLKTQLAIRQETVLQELTDEAKSKNISLTLNTQGEYQLFALNGDEPHSDESFAQLNQQQRKTFEVNIGQIEVKLRSTVRQLTEWEEEFSEKQQRHDQEVAEEVLDHFIEPIMAKYKPIKNVTQHLKAMRQDILDNLDIFTEESEEQLAMAYAALDKKLPRRYQINVLVCQPSQPFPIVVEDNPNYHSLFGYVENATYRGTVFTDFSLIRPGSLHKANGGVLLMDAAKVLEQPYVWDGLKRSLRSRNLNLSSLEREVSLSGTISLEPEPIPLDVKIVLFGDAETYRLLQHYDAEFSELFRVTAEFENTMVRDAKSEVQYAQFIASIVHDNKMLHCDKKAIARVIEYSSRQAEDQNKLSLHSADVANLLRESNYCARSAKATLIRATHVDQALMHQEHRLSRAKDSVMQSFVNGTTLITTRGQAVGQVNALSFMSTGDYQFGAPNRITATAGFGKGEVFDIERQVELGGSIHSKGVMILTAFLKSVLAKTATIPLTTYLTFEQSYGGVDGDSASMAELCAILSAYTGIPLRQDIGITGSMNQFGEAQPIGGVNEKIEGFFDVCKIKGLHHSQGVIIPHSNVHNLMLRRDIVQAVTQGKFSIWPISHVGQAVELMSGKPMGEWLQGVEYTPGSVLAVAADRLSELHKHSLAASANN